MIHIEKSTAGIVYSAHDGNTLDKVVKFLQNLDILSSTPVSKIWSFKRPNDPNKFDLVGKSLLSIIARHVDNPGIPYLITYTEAHGTYGVHSDAAHVMEFGIPHGSFLFPLTYHPHLSTIVFDQPLAIANKNTADVCKELNNLPDISEQLVLDRMTYQEQQCDIFRKKLSLKCKADWQLNSLIYWHADLLHSSLDHPIDLPVKKFIVMHTIKHE